MRDYVVAIGMALSGVGVEARSTTAPLITGGFTPDDDERATICVVAELNKRDIIHINFRTIPPYTPTGLITTIFFDGEKAHPHSRSRMLVDEHDKRVHLMGRLDENETFATFGIENEVLETRH
jgi:protocatechuate 3,4-dioxygenase beta subunit